MKMDWLKIW